MAGRGSGGGRGAHGNGRKVLEEPLGECWPAGDEPHFCLAACLRAAGAPRGGRSVPSGGGPRRWRRRRRLLRRRACASGAAHVRREGGRVLAGLAGPLSSASWPALSDWMLFSWPGVDVLSASPTNDPEHPSSACSCCRVNAVRLPHVYAAELPAHLSAEVEALKREWARHEAIMRAIADPSQPGAPLAGVGCVTSVGGWPRGACCWMAGWKSAHRGDFHSAFGAKPCCQPRSPLLAHRRVGDCQERV